MNQATLNRLELSAAYAQYFIGFITRVLVFQNSSPTEQAYLTVMIDGRLGNQMFQIASLIGISKKLNRHPVINEQTLTYLKTSFPNLPTYVSSAQNYNINFIPIQQNLPDCCRYDPSLYTRMKPNKSYKINDWLMSWKYCKSN